MMTPLPGVTPMKPGSCCLPFFGVDPVLLDPQTGQELKPVPGESQHGVMCFRKPWPSMTRTVRGDHARYMATYFHPYKGYFFTGDGATRDEDGYYWITGRVDDVMNVSGHRVGSAELESAINAHAAVAESAVLGFPHEIKGEGIACFVILKSGHVESPELISQLKQQVRTVVGAFATPDQIIISPGLPKTRSGKIMRRILRKIVNSETSPEQLGDITTLADPSVVTALIEKYAMVKGGKQ
jgi:acetyl-CoA synthetase